MHKIPNYLKNLSTNTSKCGLCIDKQDRLIKKICINSNIKKLSKNLQVSERLIYYWLKGERPIPIIKLIELGKLKNKGLLSKAYDYAEYISINGVKQKIKLCKYLTPKLSYLVGYLFGDGHIGKYHFSITDGSEENIKLAKKLLKEIFDLDVNYYHRKDRNHYEISTSWKMGILFFNKVFEMPIGSKNGKLYLPRLIKNSDLTNQKMFALGFLAADFGGNSLTQTSYKITHNVGNILKKLNIKTKIYGPYGPYKRGEAKKWVLSFNKISQKKVLNEISKTIKQFS